MSTLSGPHSANLHSAENQTDLYPSRINQEPMILKREDPVVFAASDAEAPIAKEQIQFYADNGYLFLEQFFHEQEVNEMRKELHALLQESRQSDAPEVIREPDSEEVRSVFAVHRDHEAFRKLARIRALRGSLSTF